MDFIHRFRRHDITVLVRMEAEDAAAHERCRTLLDDADRGNRGRVFRLRTRVTDMGSPAEDPGDPNGKAHGRRRSHTDTAW